MSPKLRSKPIPTRSRKKSLPQAKKTASKKSSSIKKKSIQRTVPKTPKNKKNVEEIPSTSGTADPSSASIEANNSKKEDLLITPKVMKYCLSAYKQSPDYDDLKRKRYNTSFCYESPRDREINIFTPEEEDSPKWSENLPLIKNKIKGEPGEKYADIFMSIPGLGLSDSDSEEEKNKKKKGGKKGRKKNIGYNGVPLPDECLLTDYTSLLDSPD